MRHLKYAMMAATLTTFTATMLIAGTYEIPWHTIDGGGVMFTTGGDFELSGTIGQPDAGPDSAGMSGGDFQIVGGFWPMTASSCSCYGDMNADGLKNASDIQKFVTCFINGGSCTCAELDGSPGLTTGDVDLFVSDLLDGSACP